MAQSATFRAWLCHLPLVRPIPVGLSTWTQRPTILIEARDTSGMTGWGEAAPMDGYGPDSLEEVLQAIRTANWTAALPSLACGVGTALESLGSRTERRPFLGGPSSDAWSLADATHIRPVLLHGAHGSDSDAKRYKIKVGRDAEVERALIRERLESQPNIMVRLDANGGLTRDEALGFLDGLSAFHDRIEFFEEPYPGCFDSDQRGAFPVPLAIDESMDGDNWQHADVCVLKPSLMGDPRSTLTLASSMREAGRRVVVSSTWESRVGMLMLLHLAARVGDAAPGLGTYHWIEDDLGGRDPQLLASSIDPASLPLPAPSIHPDDLSAGASIMMVEEIR